MFGKNVPSPGKLLASGVMPLNRLALAVVRQRLHEAAALHAGRLEHEFGHELWEGDLGGVAHQRLGDLVAPAGIGEAAAGLSDDGHRRRIGRGSAVEDLRQIRQRRPNLVAKEPGHADPCGHAQETAQGHRMVLVEAVGGNLPRGELGVHVLVQRELFLIDEAHGAHGRDKFRQRRRLVERLRRGALAIGAGENVAVTFNQRDAHRGHGEARHRLVEAHQTALS